MATKQVNVKKKEKSALSSKAQEALVLEYRIKARKLGRSILRRWHARLDIQEVDSIVDLSLCEAVKRFDPKKGASFMTFLYYHLKGNLVRSVSAAAQANTIPLSSTFDGQNDEFGSITALEVVAAVSGTDQRLPDELLLHKELVDLSQLACDRLDPLERQVIERLYLQGEQLMSIAKSLGYSRCHISRVKKKALENLQSEMDRALAAKLDESATTTTKARTFTKISFRAKKAQRRKVAISAKIIDNIAKAA